jgi:hypothetical protein
MEFRNIKFKNEDKMTEDNNTKLNIEFSPIKNETFLFGEQLISMRTYLTPNEKTAIAIEYLDNLSGGNPIHFSSSLAKSYFVAEYTLMLNILVTLTNIEIEGLDIGLLLNSDLWQTVKDKIKGYDQFRRDLDKIVNFQQTQNSIDQSVGNVLDQALQKILEAVNKLSELDANTIKESANKFVEGLDQLNKQVPGIAGKPIEN